MPIELTADNVAKTLANLKKKEEKPNSNILLSQVGSSTHAEYERAEKDLYVTNQEDFIRFLKALIKRDNFELQWPVLEAACGLGHLVEVLQKMYKGDVIASDIENREHWDNFKSQIGKVHYRDFLKDDFSDLEFKTIITNPPFDQASEFVRRGMELLKDGQHLMLMLRVQWLEGISRYKLFQEFPYKYVYVYTKRASCCSGGREDLGWSSITCYIWVIWEKGWKGEPILRFIE